MQKGTGIREKEAGGGIWEQGAGGGIWEQDLRAGEGARSRDLGAGGRNWGRSSKFVSLKIGSPLWWLHRALTRKILVKIVFLSLMATLING